MAKIVGYLWILLGIICAAKPGVFKGWFARRTGNKLFWVLFFLFLFVFLQLLGIALHFKDLLPKLAGIIGIIFLIKIAWDIQSKARGRLNEWFTGLPLFPFQAFGWCLIAMGVALVYFGRLP